jgi:hypothetical protein
MRMVNDRFPACVRYGFEMVDARRAPVLLRIPHQSKIYTESNHSDFSQIFGDLTSMQTLAIYRRLLIRTDCVADRDMRGHAYGIKETAGVA